LISKAPSNPFGVPTVNVDLGGMKSSFLGSSEKDIRTAMKVINGIAGDQCLCVGTYNKLEALPPEPQRRFKLGIWYFDVPSPEEREVIWKVNLTRYKLSDMKLPDDSD
jgi:hypothetical protein